MNFLNVMAAPTPSSDCPTISSTDVMTALKGQLASMCGTSVGGSASNPLCSAATSATTLKQFLANLKAVHRDVWQSYWNTDAGKAQLTILLSAAMTLKCITTQSNKEIVEDAGGIKDWFMDTMLLNLAEYKPVKDAGTFKAGDVVTIQNVIGKTLCSGKREMLIDVLIGVGGLVLGIILTSLIVYFKRRY